MYAGGWFWAFWWRVDFKPFNNFPAKLSEVDIRWQHSWETLRFCSEPVADSPDTSQFARLKIEIIVISGPYPLFWALLILSVAFKKWTFGAARRVFQIKANGNEFLFARIGKWIQFSTNTGLDFGAFSMSWRNIGIQEKQLADKKWATTRKITCSSDASYLLPAATQ